MTVHFGRNARIGEFTFVDYRNMFKAILRHDGLHVPLTLATDRALKKGSPLAIYDAGIECLAICDDILRRGVMGLTGYDFTATATGLGLINSTTRKPLSREQAQTIVKNVTEQALKFNTTMKYGRVAEIWLFGSLLSDTPVLNDIDIALVVSTTPDYHFRFEEEARRHLSVMGLSVSEEAFPLNSAVRLARRWLSESRQSRIAWVSDSVLTTLDCPCQMIFDHKRGGLVYDAVLGRHPKFKGISEASQIPRAVKPDVSFYARPEPSDVLVLSAGLESWMLANAARQLGIVTDWPTLKITEDRTSDHGPRTMDSRKRTELELTDHTFRVRQRVMLERSIKETSSAIELSIHMTPLTQERLIALPKLARLITTIDHDLIKKKENARAALLPERGGARPIIYRNDIDKVQTSK